VTRKLFSAGAAAPRGRMLPLHAHNEHAQSERVVELLRGGATIALVSDAGTPAISDPGSVVVRAARQAGQPVFAVPGPNAAIAALSVSGLAPAAFLFCGFLPATGERRRAAIEAVRHAAAALVFYESPHRIVETVADLCAVLGGARTVVIARELTKLFESVHPARWRTPWPGSRRMRTIAAASSCWSWTSPPKRRRPAMSRPSACCPNCSRSCRRAGPPMSRRGCAAFRATMRTGSHSR